MIQSIAKFNYCVIYQHTVNRGTNIHFIGREVNIASAMVMYNYLRSTVIRLSKEYSGEQWEDFCYGVVKTIADKMMSIRMQELNTDTRELMVMDTEAQKYFDDKISGTCKVRKVSFGNTAAYAEGLVAGKGVNLNKQFGLQSIGC